MVNNPFETGQCLTTADLWCDTFTYSSLNPFGAGRCLTTHNQPQRKQIMFVLIPLEQGNVLRLQRL